MNNFSIPNLTCVIFQQIALQNLPLASHHAQIFLPSRQSFQTSSSWQNQLLFQKPLYRFTESIPGPAATTPPPPSTPASPAVRPSTCPACCGATTATASRDYSSAVLSPYREAKGLGCNSTRRAAAPSAAPSATESSTAWRTSRPTCASTQERGRTPVRSAPNVSVTRGH